MNALTRFERNVLLRLKKIPRGRVTTYVAIARSLGRPQAARAVGNALNKNPQLVDVPCHRVVLASGKLGGYREGLEKKKTLLEYEGVVIDAGNRLKDFKKIAFVF